MEENRIRYPIGIQTFRNVIEGEYLYVDKTGYVHQLADRHKYVFLSRPRRFGYYTEAEVKSAVGRADAVCRTSDRIYVFEFKVDGSAEVALRRIDEKGYLIPYKADVSKELVKVGVNISTATRTIDGWIVG